MNWTEFKIGRESNTLVVTPEDEGLSIQIQGEYIIDEVGEYNDGAQAYGGKASFYLSAHDAIALFRALAVLLDHAKAEAVDVELCKQMFQAIKSKANEE